ncbi:MAG: LytTR family DNA-binding domain-containing protein [Myxococcota bacterium]
MKVRTLIVDDERLARVALTALLRKRHDVVIVDEASSVQAAIDGIRLHRPDVVLLDIELRDGTGFDVFDRIEWQPHVIFTTAYGHHAVRAFEVDAVDYLVKPIRPMALDRALSRVKERGSLQMSPLRVKQGLDMLFIRPADIRFLRAVRDYSELHLTTGAPRLVSESLGHLERRLPPGFERIHRSFIANTRHLEAMVRDNGGWSVRLLGVNEVLPVSRRAVSDLRKLLGMPFA